MDKKTRLKDAAQKKSPLSKKGGKQKRGMKCVQKITKYAIYRHFHTYKVLTILILTL